jgi:hypothetical protein
MNGGRLCDRQMTTFVALNAKICHLRNAPPPIYRPFLGSAGAHLLVSRAKSTTYCGFPLVADGGPSRITPGDGHNDSHLSGIIIAQKTVTNLEADQSSAGKRSFNEILHPNYG